MVFWSMTGLLGCFQVNPTIATGKRLSQVFWNCWIFWLMACSEPGVPLSPMTRPNRPSEEFPVNPAEYFSARSWRLSSGVAATVATTPTPSWLLRAPRSPMMPVSCTTVNLKFLRC
ncbi:hypothetical protein A4R44_07341 [Amycolatopsis sp. M39]|nr:hypothetical protein A4R44_07341 [Amycolatopsis sp. M39]